MADGESRNTQWEELLLKDYKAFIEFIKEEPAADVAEFLETLDLKQIIEIFNDLQDLQLQEQVFTNLDSSTQLEIYEILPKKYFAEIFSEMLSESRTVFFRQLSLQEQTRLLPFLKKDIRQDVITLSSYPDDIAGGIMSTDFAYIFNNMTTAEALAKIKRDAPSKKMLYYIYVVDDEMNLQGVVSLPKIIMAQDSQPINEYMNDNFVFSYVDEDREIVSSKIEKYSLVAIPIINDDGQLVGIVKYDDAIAVLIDEQTEDIEKLMGISSGPDKGEYLQTSVVKHFEKRIWWIAGLFIFTIFTSLAVERSEAIVRQFPIFAMYYPMIASTGGNTGSQTASVVIRALSLEEIKLKNIFSVVWKEFRVSILIALTLFVLACVKVFGFSYFNSPHCNVYVLALAVGLALSTQVFVSILIGALLPMLVKFFKMDPSVIASPAITTLVDITSALIYFSVVKLFIPYLYAEHIVNLLRQLPFFIYNNVF